jgi:hypothetical protein
MLRPQPAILRETVIEFHVSDFIQTDDMNADQYSKVGLPDCEVDVQTTTVKHLANART